MMDRIVTIKVFALKIILALFARLIGKENSSPLY
jgi:hypothetical protein